MTDVLRHPAGAAVRCARISALAAFVLLAASAQRLRAQCPDGTPPPCASAPRAAPAPRGSIAVLPFANRSADSTDAFLAEELPEQISGRLSRIAPLRVTSATAVAAQWRRTPDALASARALRVEWLVTGSIRRVAQQLSASVELVRTATGEQAWSSLFRRGDGDIAAIEVLVAESVAVAVGGRLAPAQVAALQRTPTRNHDAYRLYLNARALTARRTRSELDAAVGALLTALRLDSAFAAGWARLSIARSLQTQYGSGADLGRDSLMALSRSAADRALALDSSTAEGWLALGQWYSLSTPLNLGEAWRAMSRAVRLDSLNADIEHGLGYLFSCDVLGLPDQAESHFRRALALNPDLRNSWRHLGLAYEVRGQLAVAIAYFDSSLTRGLWPVGVMDRGWLRFEAGDARGGQADQVLAESLGVTPRAATIPVPPPIRRALYAAALGDSTAALAMLADSSDRWPAPVGRAVIAAAFGRREAAIAALEHLRATPDPDEALCGPGVTCSASLRTWRTLNVPLLFGLRDDPRVQRLIAETRPRAPWFERSGR